MTTPIDASAVMRTWAEPLRGFLARRVANAADVDDLLQDIFLRITEHRQALDEVEHVSGWIHRIARNAVVDHYRTEGRIAATFAPEEAGDTAPEADSPPSPDDIRRLAACLAPMVEQMAEPYREALVLTELDGLTQSEAAERVGISLSGMKSRVQRGRERLRDQVLACCDVELDRRRGVSDFESKPRGRGRGRGCGCGSGSD